MQLEENKLPFIHLFQTAAGSYFYDVNCNRSVHVSDEAYRVLLKQQKKENDIKISSTVEKEIAGLKEEGFLKDVHIKKVKHPFTDILQYHLESKLKLLILQVTQNCNLRCEYCVYSGDYQNRTHSNRKMQFYIAKKSMDYFIEHSRNVEQLLISFYGGEPCLNFKLIQQCVEYMEEAAEGKSVLYSLTTNATLLNKNIIDFFAKHHFRIMISLDGPREIHDKHRKFSGSGEGSFDTVLKNMKYIKEEYPDFYHEGVHFNTVLDVENEFKIIDDFVNDNEILSGAEFKAASIDTKNTDKRYLTNPRYWEQINYEYFKMMLELLGKIPAGSSSKLLQDYKADLRSALEENDNVESEILPEECHHGGPCLPGATRLFVTVDGDFYPCEKVSEELKEAIIGNAEEGINLELAKKNLNFDAANAKKCNECWAYLKCRQCPAFSSCNLEASDKVKNQYCENTRNSAEEELMDVSILQALGCDYYVTEKKD